VFKKADVWFSIGGKYYTKEPAVTYEYMADTILKEARNVSIRLHEQIGRFVKVELYFANVWISISEVAFDSAAAEGVFQPELRPERIAETTNTPYQSWGSGSETSTADASTIQGKYSKFPK
jgi:hypothetical protein